MTIQEELFFSGFSARLELYETLRAQLMQLFPETGIDVKKTQISFVHRYIYAMVSHPRRKSENGILLSFGLARCCDAPFIRQCTEPYPGRWTHHVLLHDSGDLTPELIELLKEAHAFALLR